MTATELFAPGNDSEEPWFYGALMTYATFCRQCPDASRADLAMAIDGSLVAWWRGVEPSAEHCATIETWVMRGDSDAVIAPALVALFTQIEVGGRVLRRLISPKLTLDRLQRRILEIWAASFRPHDPGMANMLVAASEGRKLTADDRDILEALVGEGPRGRALGRALEVCDAHSAGSA